MGPQPGSEEDDVSKLICELKSAEPGRRRVILGELVTALAGELRERASRLMAGERPNHLLQTTALFHETYLRLVSSKLSFEDRRHFLALSSRIMHEIIIDLARRTRTQKRGQGVAITALDYETADRALAMDPAVLLDLHNALEALDPEDRELVELRFFYGLTLEETAAALNVNYETLRKRWVVVRRELYHSLTDS
jgi:RNA polymerase sigma factor (TIGR02999 family)